MFVSIMVISFFGVCPFFGGFVLVVFPAGGLDL